MEIVYIHDHGAAESVVQVLRSGGVVMHPTETCYGLAADVFNKEVLDKDHVEIVSYNREWPHQAQIEIDKVRAILPKNCVIDIQHVGSTAIPWLSAKPIIDKL